LNRRHCGRSQGGFATCLIVRLEPAGRLLLANAGHPSPYVNGAEVPFAGSMPLGMIETAGYAQTEIEMRPGDQAVFVTDGIPEARNQQGALFGFPRLESLLRERASIRTVVEAAQEHGQNDDITVIRVVREA